MLSQEATMTKEAKIKSLDKLIRHFKKQGERGVDHDVLLSPAELVRFARVLPVELNRDQDKRTLS